jgi:hypothetical protein
LYFNHLKPGIFAGWLIEMPVNAYILFQTNSN